MSDLPQARLDELEDFAGPLFDFTGNLGFWWKVYDQNAATNKMLADELERLNGPPARIEKYRKRAERFALWATATGGMFVDFNALAAKVAAALGGTFGPKDDGDPHVFQLHKKATTLP